MYEARGQWALAARASHTRNQDSGAPTQKRDFIQLLSTNHHGGHIARNRGQKSNADFRVNMSAFVDLSETTCD